MSTTPAKLRHGFVSRITPAIRVASLLIGLPMVLQIMLTLTQARFGLWPSLIVTILAGVGLSIMYTTQPLAQTPADAADRVSA